ncbi:MAG: metallophosphoesterase, partial [Chloroflexi bacterium]|nr:metallophosphoesterase [Chloroflexota bacterium]
MSALVIGDIHGCYAELLELLEAAALGPEDHVIALGDIVDRGPESPQVLDFFRSQPRARSLTGNHERKHVRAYRGELRPALSQRITRSQLGEGYPAAVAFMATLPYYLELPQATLVHGYYEPGVPLPEQRQNVLAGTMGGEAHLKRRYPRPWYELYDGELPLIVGHKDYAGPGKVFIYQDRVYGLDSNCCRGGRL